LCSSGNLLFSTYVIKHQVQVINTYANNISFYKYANPYSNNTTVYKYDAHWSTVSYSGKPTYNDNSSIRPVLCRSNSFTGAYSPGWTFVLPFQGFLITHVQTHGRTPLDEWSARRRGLYLQRTKQHINATENIHTPSWIRTRVPSSQAAADLRPRPRDHWDRPVGAIPMHVAWQNSLQGHYTVQSTFHIVRTATKIQYM
jgi:hypothetical protein